jgi:hypothetical protein
MTPKYRQQLVDLAKRYEAGAINVQDFKHGLVDIIAFGDAYNAVELLFEWKQEFGDVLPPPVM